MTARTLLLSAACCLAASPALAQEMDHSTHGSAPMADAPPATDNPPPPAPARYLADDLYPGDAMRRAREAMFREHGGGTWSQIMFNLAEVQAGKGANGYRWDGEGWFGGDINRLVVKTEGEGTFRDGAGAAEVQALYARAVDPYWNLQAGVRHDFAPGRPATYAVLGVEGLAPYWFDVEAAAYVSDRGRVLGRAEATYDLRVTQRLIVQPRAELNFSAQDVPESDLGSGLTNVELGLRLRYEIRREFAPYVGISHDRKTGGTARLARLASEPAATTRAVFGIRTWF